MSSRNLIGKSFAVTLLLVACCLLPTGVYAAVPHLIRYQGSLVDTQQVSLEGPYTLTFRLYDAATGGTKVWEEAQTNVPITAGQFSVLLGQVTPLELAFDKDMWLSIQVNTDTEMTPRQRLSSAPYAYRAAVAETAQNMKTTAIEDDAYRFVPSGIIVLTAGASCPAGYTRFAAVDNKFLVAGSTYNPAAGGSNTHTHTAGSYTAPAHSHTLSRTAWGLNNNFAQAGAVAIQENGDTGQALGGAANSEASTSLAGGGTISGSSGSVDSRPEFATLLLCQKN